MVELPPAPIPEVEARVSPRCCAFGLRVGPYRPDRLDPLGEIEYRDIFGNAPGAMFGVDWEWQPIRLAWVGNLGMGASAGFFQRRGRSLQPDGTRSAERESLLIVPGSLNVTYRMALIDDQVIVPFAGAGVDAWYYANSQDGGRSLSGAKYGWHWRAGAKLLLDVFDRRGAGSMDTTWGINNTYVSVEYRDTDMTGLWRQGSGFDFSARTVFGGLFFEY